MRSVPKNSVFSVFCLDRQFIKEVSSDLEIGPDLLIYFQTPANVMYWSIVVFFK